MPRFILILLAMVACQLCLATATAQSPDQLDGLKLHVPARPPTQKELDDLKALHLFAQGVMAERQDRLVEAMMTYQDAAKLDPEAVTIQKALLMIYISMERQEDAALLLKKVLDLDPFDYEMSYLYARLLRNRGKLEEARGILCKGLESKALRDRADLHQQMEYDLGIVNERLENSEDAAAAFGRAAAILDHPDYLLEGSMSPEEIQMRTAEMYERIGRNFLDARKFDEAAAAFTEAQTRYPPGAGRLNYHLALIGLRQGKLSEAATALENYLKMMPQGTDAYELMIGVLQKQRRDAEILPWLEKASTRDTFNIGLRLLLARQCIRAGEIAKAEKIYRDLAESGPTDQIYRDLFLLMKDRNAQGPKSVADMVNAALATAARMDNSPSSHAATPQARAMIAALRENPPLARETLQAAANSTPLNQYCAEALQMFASLADRLEMLPQAESFYRECIKQPLPAATEPLVYGGMLRVLWKARHYDAVVDVCHTALKQAQASNRVLLRADMARALGALERYPEALTEADLAVHEAGDSERFTVRCLRVRLLSLAAKYTEAEAECLVLLKDHFLPGEALEVHYLLANVYTASSKLAKAEEELAACLKIDADNAAVNNDLAYLWADQNKNLAEAETMIRKAIDLDRKNRQGLLTLRPDADKEFQDNACYIDSLGWVLFRRGRIEAARKELEYAATLPDGEDPVIWDHLGDVRMALGQRQQALADWRQALHFYEEGKHRKMDERYRALEKKLKAASGK